MDELKKNELYKEVYNKHHKDMFHYALSLTKEKAAAEDIVQDSLIRAWNGLDSLKDINASKFWLLTIVKREFLRTIRKKSLVTDDIDDVDYFIAGNQNVESEYEMNEVLKVVNMLSDEYKDILILQCVYGYKIKEISQMLKINENTVSTRVFRARNKLMDLLKTQYKKEREVESSVYFRL